VAAQGRKIGLEARGLLVRQRDMVLRRYGGHVPEQWRKSSLIRRQNDWRTATRRWRSNFGGRGCL
jgi:hypothetical protein